MYKVNLWTGRILDLVNSDLVYCTWRQTLTRITRKGKARLNNSQTSIGLMSEVVGRLAEAER